MDNELTGTVSIIKRAALDAFCDGKDRAEVVIKRCPYSGADISDTLVNRVVEIARKEQGFTISTISKTRGLWALEVCW